MTHENPRIAVAMAVKILSPRRREVLAEMTLGHLSKQVVFRLLFSGTTLKMQQALLIDRLGTTTAADTIRIAVEAGL
jgi:FixJ family two-component response regulator